MNTNLSRRLAACVSLLWCASGCGGDEGPPRLPVEGRVTLDGRPLESGSVAFVPERGGPPAAAEVRDGAFSLAGSEGPGLGPYRVEVSAVRPTGRRVTSPDDPSAVIDEVRNVVPPRYNVRTELRVEVKPGGDNAYQFSLSSASPKNKGGRPGRRRPSS